MESLQRFLFDFVARRTSQDEHFFATSPPWLRTDGGAIVTRRREVDMKSSRVMPAVAAAATLLAAGACIVAQSPTPIESAGAALDRDVAAAEAINGWSEQSALVARGLMAEYGIPNEVDSGRLVWSNNGAWRQTVVANVPPSPTGGRDLGIVEQTVEYNALTAPQIAKLAAFDDRLSFNARTQELSAKSDREELNILRLNLGDDVVYGRLTPWQARAAYYDTLDLQDSGKTSRDMSELRLTH
jgi:hypothetical protein